VDQVLCWGLAPVGGRRREERAWKGEYGVNTVTHGCKWKMRPVETVPGRMGQGGE
jgi:hypothetical protein